MNIFADYLHNDLYYSLHALFEKRLKGQLFCPEGFEWQEKGFVKIQPPIPIGKIDTVDDIIQNPNIECEKLEIIDGIYNYHRKMELNGGHYIQKGITFDKFLDMDFDIILTTYWGHEEPFYNLVRKHKPNAILIRQIGNIHEMPRYCKNVLWALYTPAPSNINYIRYHPEHYEGYCYTPPTNHNIIKSFMDDLPAYSNEINIWNQLEVFLPEFIFKMHGRDGYDGSLPHLLMPQAMKDSVFIWHVKPNGGGGFLARQALACGRPCIVNKNYSRLHDELADKLFKHKINCIDLSVTSLTKCVNLIKEWSEPDRHIEICKTVAKEAEKDMNFEEEAKQIKDWINILPRGV